VVSYTSISLASLEMLQCVVMDGELRWWWSARETCYQAWQVGPLLLFLVLLPLPAVGMWLTRRWLRVGHDVLSPVSQQCLAALQGGYRDEMGFWTGVSLYRRLVLVLMFVFISDPAWQSVFLATACVAYVVTNMRYRPFRSVGSHCAECCALATLTLLAASSVPAMARLTMRAPVGVPNEAAFEALQFLLFLLPILGYAGMHLGRVVAAARNRFRPRTAEPKLEEERELAMVFLSPPTREGADSAEAAQGLTAERQLLATLPPEDFAWC
jgi:hypothetical protein